MNERLHRSVHEHADYETRIAAWTERADAHYADHSVDHDTPDDTREGRSRCAGCARLQRLITKIYEERPA